MHDPHTIYRLLVESEPAMLCELPRDKRGIYALWDHEGIPRYIGMVGQESQNFHKRIDGRHRGGSEENSHKFAAAYNTGRMWRDRKRIALAVSGAVQTIDSAAAAKKLRMEFIRQYCRAVVVPIEPQAGVGYIAYVRALESKVQSLAAPEHRLWETQRMTAFPEPTKLVDDLIDRLLSTGLMRGEDVGHVERQAVIQLMTT